jgi:hypothetical protein
MKYDNDPAIEKIGRCPFAVMMMFTLFLAMAGALLVILLGGSAIWGAWIPLCCFTIPSIYYLCREVLVLRKRITDLEKKLALP